jgi:hypothetical protein
MPNQEPHEHDEQMGATQPPSMPGVADADTPRIIQIIPAPPGMIVTYGVEHQGDWERHDEPVVCLALHADGAIRGVGASDVDEPWSTAIGPAGIEFDGYEVPE